MHILCWLTLSLAVSPSLSLFISWCNQKNSKQLLFVPCFPYGTDPCLCYRIYMKITVSRLKVCVATACLVFQPQSCVWYSVNLELCRGLNFPGKYSSHLGMGVL